MHSIYARINNVTTIVSSCLMVLLSAIALSSFLFTADPKGDLLVPSVKVLVTSAGSVFASVVISTDAKMSYPLADPYPFMFPRFVGRDRRFHQRSQEYAVVNFNVSAGVYSFHTAIQLWRLSPRHAELIYS